MILDEACKIINEGVLDKYTIQSKLNKAIEDIGGESLEQCLSKISQAVTRSISAKAYPLIKIDLEDGDGNKLYTIGLAIFYKSMIFCGDFIISDFSNNTGKAERYGKYYVSHNFRLSNIGDLSRSNIPEKIIVDLINTIWKSRLRIYPKISKNTIKYKVFSDRLLGPMVGSEVNYTLRSTFSLYDKFAKKYKELESKDGGIKLIYKPE